MEGIGGFVVTVCGICQKTKRSVMDHDHLTGLCRGRICEACNRNLGWFERHVGNIAAYLDAEPIGVEYKTHRSYHKERLAVRMASRRRRQKARVDGDPVYRALRNEKTKAINRARWAANPEYRARRGLEIRLQKLWKEVMPNDSRTGS